MLWYYGPALLMLLHPIFCFPRGKVTEKPEIPPLMVNPKQRRPMHISEFTDPDTGLNPFLDLEEGRAAMGRNVMEDERQDDNEPSSYFGMDIVEGDTSPDRKWSFEEEPKEQHQPGRAPPDRWQEQDYKDYPTIAVPRNPPPSTTTAKPFARDMDIDEVTSSSSPAAEDHERIQQVNGESFLVSRNTVIYATATVAAMSVIVLIVGVFWWRRKLKSSRSTSTVESGSEVVKS